jgi:hypothetical protein
MTLAEFKAWFEGFTESMDGAPDEKQWKRIKARVKEIDGVAITKTVFVDRYVSPGPWRPYWSSLDMVGSVQNFSDLKSMAVGKASGESFNNAVASLNADQFDSHTAMLDLGKADYHAALSA